MEASIECTHCRVVMTSWSAPGSPIRYYQCPFCARTHSSLYGEVFRRRAGARVVEAPAHPARPSDIPMASRDEMHWASVKKTAARWFARLEADERRCASQPSQPSRASRASRAFHGPPAANEADVPELDPADVVEIVPAAGGRRR